MAMVFEGAGCVGAAVASVVALVVMDDGVAVLLALLPHAAISAAPANAAVNRVMRTVITSTP